MKKLLSIMILVLFAAVSFAQLGGSLTQKKADTRYAKNPSTMPTDTVEQFKEKLGLNNSVTATDTFYRKSEVDAKFESLFTGRYARNGYYYRIKPTARDSSLIPNWSGLLTNLISVWEFDETSGTSAANGVVGAPSGTASGGVTVNQTGLLGKAYQFDGVNGQISFTNSSIFNLTDNYSVGYILKMSSFNWYYLLRKQGNEGDPYKHSVGAGNSLFANYTTATVTNQAYQTSSTTMPTAQFFTLVFTKQGASTKVYLNGVYKETLTTSTPLITSTGNLYFSASSAPYAFSGFLDHLSIWGRVLSSDDITTWNTAVNNGKDHTKW